jgi:branched-chain amino acid transport system ATP-binding protein
VIGRNGVGKTTMPLDHLGPHHLHKGEVLLSGKSLNRVPVCIAGARGGLGFVPQEREIFPSLSVRRNLDVGARAGHWTQERVFELFPEPARSGLATAATSSPAASSRCCRSRARC